MIRGEIMNDEITNDISKIVDYLDNVIYMLQKYNIKTRENEIAMQKLEEAVFWLTYGVDENER